MSSDVPGILPFAVLPSGEQYVAPRDGDVMPKFGPLPRSQGLLGAPCRCCGEDLGVECSE